MEETFSKMLVSELRSRLSKLRLPTDGRKDELVQRLVAALAPQEATAATPSREKKKKHDGDEAGEAPHQEKKQRVEEDVLPVEQSWTMIESWLEANEPNEFNILMNCKGLSKSLISKLEKPLGPGASIHPDLKESLRRHDLSKANPIKFLATYGYSASLKVFDIYS